MKSTLLKLVVVRAKEKPGMGCCPVEKYFTNDIRSLTTKEVVLEIMMQDLGL